MTKKGDKLTFEKGVTPAFRNPGDASVKVYNTHEPALDMEGYFEDVCIVIDRASNNRPKAISMKSLKTLLLFGVLMNNYRKEIIAVYPPDLLLRVMGVIASAIGIDYKKATNNLGLQSLVYACCTFCNSDTLLLQNGPEIFSWFFKIPCNWLFLWMQLVCPFLLQDLF